MNKTYIYNKVGASARRMACLMAMPLLLASCVDTIILPDDKTVDEDFWQSKEDVQLMVNGAYAGMTAEDVIARLLVWGDYRSDEMVRSKTPTGTIPDALEEITSVNIQTTNTFAQWAPIYAVINRCNIVLERAEAVMQLDPNYTQYDYEADRCQMLALRSLCYFYLVRNFRDVPYVTTAYMNSSQNMQVGQSSPQFVIDQLIQTMEEVAVNPNVLRATSFNNWKRVGWFTIDGVHALLADLYLWRASVNHSAADYQQCIDYCERVIESKRAQHIREAGDMSTDEYPLARNTQLYSQLFVNQNAEESIFELQSRSNSALCKYLFKYANNNSSEGWVKAANIFGMAVSPSNPSAVGVYATTDMRYYAACFRKLTATSGDDSYEIAKMINNAGVSTNQQPTRVATRSFSNFSQNYIVYRLTDVMLMEAEARVQLATDVTEDMSADDQTAATQQNAVLMESAFHLVQAVHRRALAPDNQGDSLQWATFRGFSKNQMELLVMAERLRELCFEGKRWYDLLRYNYRHVEGVNYAQSFAEQQAAAGTDDIELVPNYKEFLNMMTRSQGSDAAGIQAKMRNEAFLYMPIPNADIIVCPLLKQNPVYKSTNEFEKSY